MNYGSSKLPHLNGGAGGGAKVGDDNLAFITVVCARGGGEMREDQPTNRPTMQTRGSWVGRNGKWEKNKTRFIRISLLQCRKSGFTCLPT